MSTIVSTTPNTQKKGMGDEGGTLEEIKLSPDEYEERSADIESFRKMLY